MSDNLNEGVQDYPYMHKGQLEYLKTWVGRTRSDVLPIKENISTYPQTAISLCGEILNNLDELEKYLEGLDA